MEKAWRDMRKSRERDRLGRARAIKQAVAQGRTEVRAAREALQGGLTPLHDDLV